MASLCVLVVDDDPDIVSNSMIRLLQKTKFAQSKYSSHRRYFSSRPTPMSGVDMIDVDRKQASCIGVA